MPLDDSTISKEPDGTFNEDYCKWCYADGKYTYDNMENLIEFCAGHMANDSFSPEQVRVYMKGSTAETQILEARLSNATQSLHLETSDWWCVFTEYSIINATQH